MEDGVYWTRELSVGVEEIDRQHQELFRRVNGLLSSCATDHQSEDTGRFFQYLHSYVQEHFSAEEALMREARYPDLERHRRQHLGFCRRLNELNREFPATSDALQILTRLNEMVIEWLYEHICMEDRKLGTFLSQQEPFDQP